MSLFPVLVCWFSIIKCVYCQCYSDSDISIYQSGYPTNQFQESNNQCLADYTVISASIIDESASKGITCSRKDSTATGTWTLEGVEVDCNDTTGPVRCTRQQPGSVTLYTAGPYDSSGDDAAVPEGNFTCCIDGLCTSIRLWQFATVSSMFPYDKRGDSRLDSCTFIPPSDITAIPQQYMIQMTTSVFPPSRLASFIDCINCDSSVTLGESYYTYIDLTNERYQFTVPVNWSVDSNTEQQYRCRIRHGGLTDSGSGTIITSQNILLTVQASSAPSSVSHEVVNAIAIRVSWSITGNVSGFVIIISSGLDTVTEQLTDSTIREYVVDGLLPERDYTIAVRGYYQLLGPAGTTSVRLEAGISSINGSILSVSNDLSTQQIQVNCYTFRVEPNQITWRIGSELIDSSYQPVTGSQLLDSVDQTYIHYITLNGSFSVGMSTSCDTSVNGATSVLTYELQAPSQPPSGLSAIILSSSSLSISWMSVSGVDGYIVYYNGGEAVLIEGQDSTNRTLNGLIKKITYIVDVYSYGGFYSNASRASIAVHFDVPSISSLEAQSTTSDSITLSWTIPEGVSIDNYTLTVTGLCDNVVFTQTTGINGAFTIFPISGFNSGLQYTVSIIPLNILGTGMESNVNVTVMEGTDPPSGAPVLLVPVIINSTAISLSWGEVNCTERNGAITGYSVQYNIVGAIHSTNVNVTGDVTSTVIGGLAEFTIYLVSVAAINSNGIGPYSDGQMFISVHKILSGLSTIPTTSSVYVLWEPLTHVSDVTYEYEVAYSVDPECSGDPVSLPDGYTLYYPRTSTHYIEVVGLMSGTCYVFGVRAYTSVTDSPGEFSLIQGNTISNEETILSGNPYYSASFQLTWTASSNNMIQYEVAYAVHPQGSIECTATDTTTFTELYISYLNTTDPSVNVTGLEPSTCYIFGIRVVTVRLGEVGEWTLLVNSTLAILDQFVLDQQSSSNTGLVAGSVTLSVINLTLIVLLIVQSMGMIYMKKYFEQKVDSLTNSKYETMEFESQNDYNTRRIFDDNIEMQSCEPYGLHNVPPSTDTKEKEQIYEQM